MIFEFDIKSLLHPFRWPTTSETQDNTSQLPYFIFCTPVSTGFGVIIQTRVGLINDNQTTPHIRWKPGRLTANPACVHHGDDSRACTAADAAKNAVWRYFVNICDLSQVEPTKWGVRRRGKWRRDQQRSPDIVSSVRTWASLRHGHSLRSQPTGSRQPQRHSGRWPKG